MSMNVTYGFALIAVTVVLVFLGRPSNGVPAPFLRIWIVGQFYVLAAMVSAVIGTTLIIANWPL
jgi:hypothetical protein